MKEEQEGRFVETAMSFEDLNQEESLLESSVGYSEVEPRWPGTCAWLGLGIKPALRQRSRRQSLMSSTPASRRC